MIPVMQSGTFWVSLMTRIKICGITNIDDALTAVELGADALGFVFSRSKRQINSDQANEIIASLPPYISKIGVFVDEDARTVEEIYKYCRLTAVQLHGDEDNTYLNSLHVPFYKVFKVVDDGVVDIIKKSNLPSFMLDTYSETDSGGTGKSFDWQIARKAREFGRVILSGGLNPDNIINSLEIVRPYAVDVSSGVELSPGKKDFQKMATFIKKVRMWDNRTD